MYNIHIYYIYFCISNTMVDKQQILHTSNAQRHLWFGTCISVKQLSNNIRSNIENFYIKVFINAVYFCFLILLFMYEYISLFIYFQIENILFIYICSLIFNFKNNLLHSFHGNKGKRWIALNFLNLVIQSFKRVSNCGSRPMFLF